MLHDAVECFLEFIAEDLLFYSGEVVLYLLTVGRHRPRWDYYDDVTGSKWVILTELSLYVGMTFWIGVVYLVYWLVRG